MSVIYIPVSLLLATMPLPNLSIPNQAVYIIVRKDEVLLLNSSGIVEVKENMQPMIKKA